MLSNDFLTTTLIEGATYKESLYNKKICSVLKSDKILFGIIVLVITLIIAVVICTGNKYYQH